jgi:hypothetical protein
MAKKSSFSVVDHQENKNRNSTSSNPLRPGVSGGARQQCYSSEELGAPSQALG